MDLAQANAVLPQRILHGPGQHRTPVALLGPRAALTRAEGLAEAIEELGLLGGRALPESVARGVTRSMAGKMAREDCREDAEAGTERGLDHRRIGTDERPMPLV
jgi:hypothetical protein